jgi:hypothetical protein
MTGGWGFFFLFPDCEEQASGKKKGQARGPPSKGGNVSFSERAL